MAVYTKLSKLDIENHLENYQIGKLLDYKEILAGIDNSNFIVYSEEGRFILTIFESRIKKDELPFFIDLKHHLARKGICCPKPITDKNGDTIVDLKGKKSAIVTFLSGKMLQPCEEGYYGSNITVKHCAEVGEVAAKMQVAALDYDVKRQNDLSALDFKGYFTKFSHFLKDEKAQYKFLFIQGGGEGSLYQEILQTIDFLESNWRIDLPSGATHLDLFPDNVFFNESQELSGVIDFYFAANDIFIYDFAIIVNAWCFDEDNIFIQEKFDSTKVGYESVRNFSKEEDEFLKVALVAGSLRFLLTRLHDMFNTSLDSFVTIKDPREYLEKMRYFQSQI